MKKERTERETNKKERLIKREKRNEERERTADTKREREYLWVREGERGYWTNTK